MWGVGAAGSPSYGLSRGERGSRVHFGGGTWRCGNERSGGLLSTRVERDYCACIVELQFPFPTTQQRGNQKVPEPTGLNISTHFRFCRLDLASILFSFLPCVG